MNKMRVGLCALVLAGALGTGACSGGDPGGTNAPTAGATLEPAPGSTSGSPSAPDPTTSAASPAASGPATSSPGGPPSSAAPTTANQPVPKVERSKGPKAPTVSAKPTTVDKPVRYSDGLSLRVVSVNFVKETRKGPGRFPGRQYAVLTMRVSNQSAKSLSMTTVVVTVLDKKGQPVAPVYTDEAKVEDFSGTLRAGKTKSARYAFAVPRSSRGNVTVVVDFDGAHTSAVFRGKLS